MQKCSLCVDQDKSVGDLQETLFPCGKSLHVQGLFLVCWCKRPDQCGGIFYFLGSDHKHVLLICCDIFRSMFPIINIIWKFKMESSNLGISKHASRITLILPIYHQIIKGESRVQYKFGSNERA